MATATISGGTSSNPTVQTVTLANLSTAEVMAAQAALYALGETYSKPYAPIETSIADRSNHAGQPNLYDVNSSDNGGSFNMPNAAQALVVYGSDNVSIVADSSNELIIGNQANDTIQAFGTTSQGVMAQGSGTIIVGDGNNSLALGSGKFSVMTGSGANVFHVSGTGGSLDVTGDSSQNMVSVASGSSTTITSTVGLTVEAAGNDTITFGAGNDTVIAQGSATVYGGSGTLLFHEGQTATGGDTVYAGAGNATMYGGAQASTFFGSTTGAASVQMYAGTAGDTLVGGNAHGAEVMHGGAGVDYFEFDSVNGGTTPDPTHPNHNFSHVVYGFTEGQDFVDLHGYTQADIKAINTTNGGDTIIRLTDGTQIKIMGDTHFNAATDIKFH